MTIRKRRWSENPMLKRQEHFIPTLAESVDAFGFR